MQINKLKNPGLWILFSFASFISGLALPYSANAYQEQLGPKEALNRLKTGNERFVKDTNLCSDRHQTRRSVTANVQKPFAIVLGCSDSRVPPELAFDQGIGDIFVVRVAGNVVGATELDSVEYSALYNDSSIIVVLGHGNCGAVSAVLAKNTKDIEAIAELIQPAVSEGQDLDAAIVSNIQNSVKLVKNSAPIQRLMKEGKIDVVGAYYDLNTGKVKFLEEKLNQNEKSNQKQM
jgi:carbonic anhydrase